MTMQRVHQNQIKEHHGYTNGPANKKKSDKYQID